MSEKKPIGFDANQIPMNSMLGSMAFQSFDNVKISGGKISDSILPPTIFLKNSAQALTNKLTTLTSNLNTAPFSISEGNIPSTLLNGDVFIATGGIYAQINNSLFKLNDKTKYIDSFEVLIVGGGGGGGYGIQSNTAAGGGGGGVQILKLSPAYGQQFSVIIGRGGYGGGTSDYVDSGLSTSFGQYVSLGGGGGASIYSSPTGDAENGGSGGGNSASQNFPGQGTDGQGANGHFGHSGGAGSLSSASLSIGGAGTTFFGKTYGVGGPGGFSGSTSRRVQSAGNSNPGWGGIGGPLSTTQNYGGNGGYGIVVVAYPGSQRATGGTITTSDGFTFHTFNYSGFNDYFNAGTFTWLSGPTSFQANDLVGEAIVGLTVIGE